jgi:prevent-host-death family protein
MRTVTIAEAERDLGGVLEATEDGPVLIRRERQDVVLISAAEFAEAQELLHKERVRAFREARICASEEARTNGFSDDMLHDLLAD